MFSLKGSFRFLARATAGVLLAGLVLGASEGLARSLRPSERAAQVAAQAEGWLQYSPNLGWRIRPRFRGVLFGGDREVDGDGILVGAARAADRIGPKILFLGDSRTSGNGVRTEDTFVEWVGHSLPPSRVWNLGVPGYTSFQGNGALQLHAPRLQPDVVVFAFGFNDRRYVPSLRGADGAEHFRRLARRDAWLRFGQSLASVDYLLTGWRDEDEQRTEGPRPARRLDLRTVVPRVSQELYRHHLRAAAQYCAARGIRLILLRLGEHPLESADLRRGERQLGRGRLAEAERHLRKAVMLDNAFSDAARMTLSRLYARSGRADEAARAAISPRTLASTAGGYPLATEAEYGAIVNQVASEFQLPLVDTRRRTDRHAEWFLDFCHFSREGHRQVADLLVAEIGRRAGRPTRLGGSR